MIVLRIYNSSPGFQKHNLRMLVFRNSHLTSAETVRLLTSWFEYTSINVNRPVCDYVFRTEEAPLVPLSDVRPDRFSVS